MKRLMLILTTIVIVAYACYMRYMSEVENYKNTEEMICQISTNKIWKMGKTYIYDSWKREIKHICASNGFEEIRSSGSDGRYGTDDDILGSLEKSDSGWLLYIKWNYGLDSSYSYHAFFLTD